MLYIHTPLTFSVLSALSLCVHAIKSGRTRVQRHCWGSAWFYWWSHRLLPRPLDEKDEFEPVECGGSQCAHQQSCWEWAIHSSVFMKYFDKKHFPSLVPAGTTVSTSAWTKLILTCGRSSLACKPKKSSFGNNISRAGRACNIRRHQGHWPCRNKSIIRVLASTTAI